MKLASLYRFFYSQKNLWKTVADFTKIEKKGVQFCDVREKILELLA
jgi:hypothetical protein